MRKLFVLLLFSVVLGLAACSGGSGKFQKELLAAKEAMNEMEYEKALEILEEIETDILPKDPYKAGRLLIVEDLQNDAHYMIEHIEDLKNDYDEAMAAYESLGDADEKDVELYHDTYYELDRAASRFGDMHHLTMYSDLEKAKDELVTKVETELVGTIVNSIEADLEAQTFENVDYYLDELRKMYNYFPDIYSEEDYQGMKERVEQEKDKYIAFPYTIQKWELPLHEKEYGSIKIIGYQEKSNNDIDLYVEFDGVYSKARNDVNLRLEALFGNGDKRSANEKSSTNLPDKHIRVYSLSIDESQDLADIVRINVNLPIASEELIGIKIDPISSQGEVKIEGVTSLVNVLEPNWTIETDAYDITVNQMEITKDEIMFSGKVTPKEDLTIDTYSYAYLPFNNEFSTENRSFWGSSTKDFYEGTSVEFELIHSFNGISSYNDYVELMLYGEKVFVDLKTGQIMNPPSPVSVLNIHHDFSSGAYPYIDQSNQRDAVNADGKFVENGLVLNRSNTHEWHLGGKFKTFKAKVQSYEYASGADRGPVTITFFSDDSGERNELYSVEVDHASLPTDIQFNVTGIDTLKMSVSFSYGDNGFMYVILENPVVE